VLIGDGSTGGIGVEGGAEAAVSDVTEVTCTGDPPFCFSELASRFLARVAFSVLSGAFATAT